MAFGMVPGLDELFVIKYIGLDLHAAAAEIGREKTGQGGLSRIAAQGVGIEFHVEVDAVFKLFEIDAVHRV